MVYNNFLLYSSVNDKIHGVKFIFWIDFFTPSMTLIALFESKLAPFRNLSLHQILNVGLLEYWYFFPSPKRLCGLWILHFLYMVASLQNKATHESNSIWEWSVTSLWSRVSEGFIGLTEGLHFPSDFVSYFSHWTDLQWYLKYGKSTSITRNWIPKGNFELIFNPAGTLICLY